MWAWYLSGGLLRRPPTKWLLAMTRLAITGGARSFAGKSDEHLHDSCELVLRAGCVLEGNVALDAQDVDGCGAFHRGALGHCEEVPAVALRPAGTALGEVERDRCGGAVELIAE